MRPRRPHRRAQDIFGWLELVETEGPFLSRPALKAQFPAGLARPDGTVDGVREAFRTGFSDWETAWTTWMRTANRTEGAPLTRYLEARDAWVRTMTTDVLEWGEYVRADDSAHVQASNLDHTVTVSSAATLQVDGSPAALLFVVDPTEDLTAPGDDRWAANAVDRAAALLRASGEASRERIPVAVVTDGRWWALVWQSAQGSTGSGVFDGALFREEPDLRDAFWALARLTSLAGGAGDRRLPALLEASVASAEEITDALGNQVRASVELLVQSFSASHLRALADGASSPLPANGHEVYDAAVTSMMRIIFLLFAEANELLPTEQLYREAYSISDVFDRLDERRRNAVGVEGDEALAATYDTWHRLLATSRALYEGATFEDLRMPAYGGSLFDPDRFAWLTAVNESTGGLRVLVDDRVLFHVLRSVQHAQVGGQDRQVSFRELDVEQIGYVYEGLLGYSARYTDEVIVGLDGPPGFEPEVPLEVLHELNEQADEDADDFATRLVAWVKEDQPGAKTRTARQLAKAYEESGNATTEDEARRRLRPVVGDEGIVEELIGYYKLMRLDSRGLPHVIPAGGLVVVETRSRATSGTHYTPRSLAEEVVHHALEPLVYSPGPLQTADTARWRLISSSQILDLKVADIAVGSGAFLVAAARYLGERLLEAWDSEGITREDQTADQRRRRAIEARREVIAHSLYGADINQMAVEMCKLSLWLVSLDPDRPFSFVDDKIFCGNSLLGLTELRQLRGLHIDPPPARLRNPGFTVDADLAIHRATEVRHQLASTVSETDAMRSTRAKRQLMKQLNDNLSALRTMADAVIAAALPVGGKKGKALDEAYENLLFALMRADLGEPEMLDGIIDGGLKPTVETDYDRWRPLHWVLEAPDVIIEHGGFDAVIGNPPFLVDKRVGPSLGTNMRAWLFTTLASKPRGRSDLAAFFIHRAVQLSREAGATMGLIVPSAISEGDTREVGLDLITANGWRIYRANRPRPWPARSASITYSSLWLGCGTCSQPSRFVLDGTLVEGISPSLTTDIRDVPKRLKLEGVPSAYRGSDFLGSGFIIDRAEACEILAASERNRDVVRPFINGETLYGPPSEWHNKWIIDFRELSRDEAESYAIPWAIVSARVRPGRMEKDAKRYPRMVNEWWKHWNSRPGLYAALSRVDSTIAISNVSRSPVPVIVPVGAVFSSTLVVIPTDDRAIYASMFSSMHLEWALRWGSTHGASVRYGPTDVYQTFPFPPATPELARLGERIETAFSQLMNSRDVGATAAYAEIGNPDNLEDSVRELRRLIQEADARVAHGIGLDGERLTHEFVYYGGIRRYSVSRDCLPAILDGLMTANLDRATSSNGEGRVP